MHYVAHVLTGFTVVSVSMAKVHIRLRYQCLDTREAASAHRLRVAPWSV